MKITLAVLIGLMGVAGCAFAAEPGTTGARQGATLYVSKLGDDSDGSSWPKAFRTVQRALSAVSDDRGGHRIVVRPDTYIESLLYPSQKGAAGAYNTLVGDFDGGLGSGTVGRVVIDGSEPLKGLKSGEISSSIRSSKSPSPPTASPTFSGNAWDRWRICHVYATGTSAALLFDLAGQSEPFSVVVEDCVGIGRRYGGGVVDLVGRADEPVVFRRCKLYSLDWGGDCAAAKVVAANRSKPDHPDAVFEDCALVGADRSLQSTNVGDAETFTRVQLKNSRLINLNFTQYEAAQPRGCPSEGLICCHAADGQQLHVDFENCTLMGYRIFGTRKGEISYSTKGKVEAYVQFQQTTPAGFERLGLWPVQAFADIAPGVEGDKASPAVEKSAAEKATTATAGTSALDPTSPSYTGRKGRTFYVSKLGDNSDGTSWQKAFRTIQGALWATPDSHGGHRIIIRPDTYAEANLYPSHTGKAGAYNAVVGDVDGSLGSGATGWVVIDSSCPGVAARHGDRDGFFEVVESQLPETGLKCVDYWVATRCDGDIGGLIWDRWIFRDLYFTGSEGFGFDLGRDTASPFSAIVEDCVGIGRFAGAYMAGHVGRKDEPVVFRRSWFMNLDWWGDAGGVYVRAHNKTMQEYPDAVYEDCTFIGPDNAMQIGFPAFTQYTRVRMKDCRLIAMNFSPPGGNSSGIIGCDTDPKYCHIDFENCLLMGSKPFGSSRWEIHKVGGTGSGMPSYAVKGKVQAYIEADQPALPDGLERLDVWPVQLFDHIAPPKPSSERTKSK